MAIRSLVAFIFVLGACGVGAPTSPPDITGTITHTATGVILVEERPADISGSAKASIRLMPGTTYWKTVGPAPRPASASDLREGLRVQASFDGPVLTSYPVQAAAKAILILEN